METEAQRYDLLGPEVSPLVLAGLAFVGVVVWLASGRLRGRWERGWVGLVTFIVRAALAGAMVWLMLQTISRLVVLATPWPVFRLALVGGVALQAVMALYRLEQQLVEPRRGRLLLTLRLAAVVVVLLILAQPVFSTLREREIEREVVVLVDDSESMQLVDERHALGDLFAVAALFDPKAVEGRPDVGPAFRAMQRHLRVLNRERAALEAPAGSPAAFLEGLLERRRERVATGLAEARADLGVAWESLETAATGLRRRGGEEVEALEGLAARMEEPLERYLRDAEAHLRSDNQLALTAQLDSATRTLGELAGQLATLQPQLDEAFFRTLDAAAVQRVEAAARKPRGEIARRALLSPGGEAGKPFIEILRERYQVRFARFGETAAEMSGERWLEEGVTGSGDEPESFRAATDLTAALEDVLGRVAPETLAGVVVLTDGRHNGEVPVEDAARQLGTQISPAGVAAIGSRIGPMDASILRVEAPQSVYLGDRVGIRAELKMDGLAGKEVAVRLLDEDGSELAREEVKVPEARYRTEVRLSHTPEAKGIRDYTIAIEPLEGERFETNNEWRFKCAITDDRTNVLLVDSFPRWEFRYLRNLFYGRDKSVHLQYVLLNPDRIEGQAAPPAIAASATREFGEAEATELPANAEEWRGFDAILLGDVPPGSIPARTWGIIEDAVANRGTMLVCIAGTRYMPHAYRDETFAKLLPVRYTPGRAPERDQGDGFQLALTTAGASSPILQQSLSRSQNQVIWDSLPLLPWRYRPDAVKEGAEVLAYAVPEDGDPGLGEASELTGAGNATDVQAALEALMNRRVYEREEALLVTQRYGLGLVVMMNFDSTWRFRFGVGDTYHHRFWGQMLRWGTGENLRAGSDLVRLGTDRLSYTPLSPIRVTAKVLEPGRKPVRGGTVYVEVFKGAQRLQRQSLRYREDSNGIFEVELDPLAVEGDYRLVLGGGPVERALAASGMEAVETELQVVTRESAKELAEVTADRDQLNQVARLSGGSMVGPDELHDLLPIFGAPREVLEERHDVELWDQWPLLALFVGLVTVEWLARRGSGLA